MKITTTQKIILSIITASLIVGVSIITSQILKQRSIERQVEIKLQQEKDLATEKALQESLTKYALNKCISEAEDTYWEFIELNGSKDDEGVYWAADKYWKTAEERKERAIDLCFKLNK